MLQPLLAAERSVVGWMARHSATAARLSLGIVFIWFGALKPLGMSPATDLVTRLVAPGVDPAWFVTFLGWWEVAIGACFIIGRPAFLRLGILLMAMHLPGTFLPVFFLTDEIFIRFPFCLSLEGQYIAKNFVLVSAALAVGGTLSVRQSETPHPKDRSLQCQN